jgi:hypothetical protein
MGFPVSLEGNLRDVKETSATQKHALGTRLVLNDGRVFHYAKNGAAILAVGKLVASPIPDADEMLDLPPDSACTTAARNATLIADMSTASAYLAASRFKDGYMYVNTGTGAGQIVQLSDNDKGGTTADGTIKVYFKDEEYLSVALDTSSSKAGLIQNPYNSVVVSPAWADLTGNSRPLGVPMCTVPASHYFWLQTWGTCPVIAGGTPVIGQTVIQGGSSTGTAGDVNFSYKLVTSGAATGNAVNFPGIGIVMAGDTDAEYVIIFLMIDP